MNLFPGWRIVAEAMHWARRQAGVTVTVHRHPLPRGCYIVHTWTSRDGSVKVGHDPNFGSDITVTTRQVRRALGPPISAIEALTISAEIGLLPFNFANAALATSAEEATR